MKDLNELHYKILEFIAIENFKLFQCSMKGG